MKHPELSNADFLDAAINKQGDVIEHVLLPHEQAGVDEAYDKRVKEFDSIVEQKVSVSGGDDWHDGAFRATDNAAKIVTEVIAGISPYLSAPVVDYPGEDEARVTLGSRVSVTQNNFAFQVDIIGFRSFYPKELIDPDTQEEVTPTTPDSPLGKAILGKIVGDEVGYRNGDRGFTVSIDRINQSVIREYFMAAGGVDLEIGDD